MGVYKYLCVQCSRQQRDQPGFTFCHYCTKVARHLKRLAELVRAASRNPESQGEPPDVLLARVWLDVARRHYPEHAPRAREFLEYIQGTHLEPTELHPPEYKQGKLF